MPPARPFRLREAADAIWGAKWELLVPTVVLLGIFGGYATLGSEDKVHRRIEDDRLGDLTRFAGFDALPISDGG